MATTGNALVAESASAILDGLELDVPNSRVSMIAALEYALMACAATKQLMSAHKDVVVAFASKVPVFVKLDTTEPDVNFGSAKMIAIMQANAITELVCVTKRIGGKHARICSAPAQPFKELLLTSSLAALIQFF